MPYSGNALQNIGEEQAQAIRILCDEYLKYNKIDPVLYDKFNVKRGLRNQDGTGVIAGITHICNVHGYVLSEGERVPIPGELIYRGINMCDIVDGCHAENRFGYEETVWLLLFGNLPTSVQLAGFQRTLCMFRELPPRFANDVIFNAPSRDIMNMLSRAVLSLYSFDDRADDTSLENVMRQCIELIARLPAIMVSAYQVKRRAFDGESMVLHPSISEHSSAENILSTIRTAREFTTEEAKLLDLMLILHAEHGGGNNSSFTCRALTSSGTDTYATIAGAIGSLKGPRHGGANAKVMQMLECIKAGVRNWEDENEVADFLRKIIHGEAGDGSGLIYGIGHAIYTKSDPRAVVLKKNASDLAKGSEYESEFRLLETIERLAPEVFYEHKGDAKVLCANVDFYSGFVYKMLGIPPELFTPLFAVARIGGWCAHRIEELTTCKRIIRPAYKAIDRDRPYLPLSER
ncbi:MAG: citrate/2-methylcitrate synthase [Acetanaerobacterium sp.]